MDVLNDGVALVYQASSLELVAAQDETAVEVLVGLFRWLNVGVAEFLVRNDVLDHLVEDTRIRCVDPCILDETGRQLVPGRVATHVQLLAEGHVIFVVKPSDRLFGGEPVRLFQVLRLLVKRCVQRHVHHGEPLQSEVDLALLLAHVGDKLLLLACQLEIFALLLSNGCFLLFNLWRAVKIKDLAFRLPIYSSH